MNLRVLALLLAVALPGCLAADPDEPADSTPTPPANPVPASPTPASPTPTSPTVASPTPASPTPTSPTPTSPTPTTVTPTPSTDVDVGIQGFAFQPAAIKVARGGTVTWTNFDASSHTATAADGSFDSGTLTREKSFTHAFPTAGTFAYVCAFHSSMKGTVTVE